MAEVIAQRLRGVLGAPAQARAGGEPVPFQITLTITIPPNTPRGASVSANIQVRPGETPVTIYDIPLDRDMLIEDIFIKSSGDVALDGQLQIVRNEYDIVAETPNISTLLSSNPSRPRVPPKLIPRGSKLAFKFLLAYDNGTSTVTNTVYVTGRWLR